MMKRLTLFVVSTQMAASLLMAASLFLLGCSEEFETVEIPAAGDTVIESYDLTGFNQVEVAHFFEVEIFQGESFQVVIEAERQLVPHLTVQVRGRRLQVGLRPGANYRFQDASHRVEVTLPTLTHARVTDHSTLVLTGLQVQETMQLEATDFSTLHASVDAGELQVEVTEHSSLILTGSAAGVTGEVTSFSSADLTGLDAGQVNIEADGRSTLDK